MAGKISSKIKSSAQQNTVGVIIAIVVLLVILLVGVLYYVVYILNISFKEMSDGQAQEQEREVRKCEAEPGQRNSEEG